MLKWIDDLIGALERRPYSVLVLAVAVTLIGVGRTLLEVVLANRQYLGVDSLNNCIFYFAVAWGFTVVLAGLTGTAWRQVVMVVLAGLSVGLLPPLIDVWLYGVGNFVYTYYFGLPDLLGLSLFDVSAGMPFGEGLCLWGAVVFAAYYVFLKTRSPWRAVLGAAGVYLLVFMLAGVALPSLGRKLGGVLRLPDMALTSLLQIVLGLLFYLSLRPKLAVSLLKRSLHCLPFVLICLIGMAMSGPLSPLGFVAAGLILLTGLVALVQNDYYDRVEDGLAGREQVVVKDDVDFIDLLFAGLILTVYWSGGLLYLTLGLIYLLALCYHHEALRAKRVFPLNQVIEGLWGLLAYLSGVLAIGAVVFTSELAFYCLLVFGGWMLLSACKDAKDLEVDAAVGNRNVYNYLGTLGIAPAQTHRLIAVATIAFCSVPYAWLWFKHLRADLALAFPLVTLPALAWAYTRPPGRRGVVLCLLALCYTLLLFLLILLIAYVPEVAPR